MTRPLKIRKWGGSYGITLPRQVLDDLGVTEGDLLYPVRTPNGIELTRFDPEFAEIMEDAEDYMRRHRNAMRELAK
jgi:putative addiction module antidote